MPVPALDPVLAQRVVDVVATTLRHDVNLMDDRGEIVASTAPERRGQPHRAAREVLATGRSVVVDRAVEGVGDRPGVNVPLEVDGRLVGVVGVTGDPAEVEPVARVVALTARLLLARERERDRADTVGTRVRELVGVLGTPGVTAAAAGERLRGLGIDRGPWTIGAWAAREVPSDGTATPPDRSAQVVAALNDRRTATGAGGAGPCAVVAHGLLWVVAGGARPVEPDLGGVDARRVVVGGLGAVEDLASWVQDLRALARVARLLPTAEDEPGWSASAAVAVAHLPDGTRRRTARTAALLTPQQRATVRAVARSTSLTAAAAAALVHRNTLLQRVERVHALTGLDLRRPDEAAALLGAVLAHEALGGTHTDPR